MNTFYFVSKDGSQTACITALNYMKAYAVAWLMLGEGFKYL